MRVFAIGLVVITFSAFIAYAVFMSNVRFSPIDSMRSRPVLEGVRVTVASVHGWDVITGREVGAIQYETGSCIGPYDAMPEFTHAGRARVTLEIQPQRDLVITAVRVRVTTTTPPVREAKHVHHCTGPAGAPATRVRVDASGGTSYPVEGPFPHRVPAEGYRQDIEVELHGEQAVDWWVELDYTLGGQSGTFEPAFQRLVTEPVPADADDHRVWCEGQWRPGERC